ncbi:MAG TPA: hypothetical protein VNJ31_10830 [Methyloceanibacter sp.]|nr:hypothetical protein [Methyloceanibacter sp.]
MRLRDLAATALIIIWLALGSAEAGRLWLPQTENPYCDVSTYLLRDVPEQAMSMLDTSGKPAIVVNRLTLTEQPSYGKFLMAHECCHHKLGHVGRYREGLGHVGPQPFFYIAPVLRQMELEADCCAVKLLKERQEIDSIESAESAMAIFGDKPTGAYYPTGNERVQNIAKCASGE